MSLCDNDHFTTEKEEKQGDDFIELIRNFEKCCEEENELYHSILLAKKKDYEKWVQQKNKIEDLKVRKVDIQKNICNIEHKITDLEQQMMTTEVEIQNKLVVKNNLVEQCRILEMKTNKLKHVHQMLLESRKLYEHYFSCSLSYEPPDKYNFSILKNNVKFGEIKFQYNEQRSRWAVLQAEPSDILNEYILQKFHQIQDTQGLLCYFREHLLGDVS